MRPLSTTRRISTMLPLRPASRIRSRASAWLVAMGFSMRTCFPVRSAAMAISTAPTFLLVADQLAVVGVGLGLFRESLVDAFHARRFQIAQSHDLPLGHATQPDNPDLHGFSLSPRA